MASFKERLIQAMDIRRISAAELSRVSKVNEGAISQYRKGRYKASQPAIEQLAKALNVSIPWLMGAVDTFGPFEYTISTGNLSDEEKELLASFRKLNTDGKEKVIDYTRDIAGNKQYTVKNVISAS